MACNSVTAGINVRSIELNEHLMLTSVEQHAANVSVSRLCRGCKGTGIIPAPWKPVCDIESPGQPVEIPAFCR